MLPGEGASSPVSKCWLFHGDHEPRVQVATAWCTDKLCSVSEPGTPVSMNTTVYSVKDRKCHCWGENLRLKSLYNNQGQSHTHLSLPVHRHRPHKKPLVTVTSHRHAITSQKHHISAWIWRLPHVQWPGPSQHGIRTQWGQSRPLPIKWPSTSNLPYFDCVFPPVDPQASLQLPIGIYRKKIHWWNIYKTPAVHFSRWAWGLTASSMSIFLVVSDAHRNRMRLIWCQKDLLVF